jgi:hypothetical protein
MDRERTDEAMGDFGRQIGELREEMRDGFKQLRSEIGGLREEVRSGIGELRGETHDGFTQIRSEFNMRTISVERSLTMIWVSLTGGMAGFVAALIATNL